MQNQSSRDGLQPWSWPLPAAWDLANGARSNDLGLWRQALMVQAQRLGFGTHTLGVALGEPLWMLVRPAAEQSAPRRLLACGFHGEEPAGPWGLLRFFQSLQAGELDAVHLSVLPLVNCTGFAAGTRFNREGDNPNRGFTGLAPASAEGRLLLQHEALLRQASPDGVLSCHEDVQADCAYIYALEAAKAPGARAQRLLNANLKFFARHPDGWVDGCRVQSGVIFNHHDGSFEDWLFGQGARFAACVETPGRQPFESRVLAQAEMMRAFVMEEVQPAP